MSRAFVRWESACPVNPLSLMSGSFKPPDQMATSSRERHGSSASRPMPTAKTARTSTGLQRRTREVRFKGHKGTGMII